MSNANVTIVQSMYAAFGKGDIATIIAAVTPDIDWHSGGRVSDFPTFGPRKGPKEVGEFFKTVADNNDFSEFSPREFYADGDKVFVLGHYAHDAQEERQENRQRLGPHLHVPRRQGGPIPRVPRHRARGGSVSGLTRSMPQRASGPPAFFQASIPPWMWQAAAMPASCAACTAIAERSPKAQ